MVQVDLEAGTFLPHPEANCKVSDLSKTGVYRTEYLNCGLVPSRYSVTATTEPINEDPNGA